MTRTEIRTFLQTGVEALTPSVTFGFGLDTDFNSKANKVYPTVWWVTEKGVSTDIIPSTQTPLDIWSIQIIVGVIDKMDSIPEEYEDIIDRSDLIAQKLVFAYNQVVEGYKLLRIEGLSRTPFIKKFADCISGVYLEFTISTVSTVTNCP